LKKKSRAPPPPIHKNFLARSALPFPLSRCPLFTPRRPSPASSRAQSAWPEAPRASRPCSRTTGARGKRERERRIGAKWGDSLDAPLLSRKPRPLKTSQKQKTNFQLSLQPLVQAHEGRRPELLRQAQEPAGAQVPVDRLRRQPRAGEERVVVAFFLFLFDSFRAGSRISSLEEYLQRRKKLIFRLAQRLFFSFVSLPHASFALRFSLRLSRNSKKRNRPTKSSASTPGRSLSR